MLMSADCVKETLARNDRRILAFVNICSFASKVLSGRVLDNAWEALKGGLIFDHDGWTLNSSRRSS
jgi:hypothetical protein